MRGLGRRALASFVVPLALGAAPLVAAPFAATKPTAGSELRSRRPTLVFAGELPAGIERQRLRVFIDGDDVTEFAVWTGERLRIAPPLPLGPGQHVARVVAGTATTEPLAELPFTVLRPTAAKLVNGKFSDSILLEIDSDEDAQLALQPHVDGGIAVGGGTLGYDITFEHELQFDGNDDEFDEPDAVLQFDSPGSEVRLGRIGKPYAFSDSEFLGVTANRQALEAVLGSGSPISLLSNLADSLPKVTGERGFDQRLHGGSWQLPIGGERLGVRLLGLTVEDRRIGAGRRAPLPRPERARMIGALIDYQLSEGWQATFEIASSDRDVDEAATRTTRRDEAFRLELDGSLGGHRLEARFARVGGRFANPADPRLANDRQEAEIDLSRRSRRWGYKLEWRSASDGLEAGVEGSDEERLGLSLNRRFGELEAKLQWSRHTVDSADAGSEQTRSRLTLGRSWKRWRVDLEGARTESQRRGYGFSGSEQESLKASWRRTAAGPWTFRGSLGHSERRQPGRDRTSRDLFLEPGWRAPAGRLSAALNLSLGDDEAPGRNDRTRRAARGTIRWQLGASERWLLSLDLTASETEDRLAGTELSDDRALIKLTYSPQWTWGGR